MLTISDPTLFIGMLIGGGRALPVQLDDHPRGGPGGVPDRQGMPHPVPRQGNLGRHEEARLRARGRYLHRLGSERTDRSGIAGHAGADAGRFRTGRRSPWPASSAA